MSQYGYTLIALTAMVGVIAGFLAFALLRVGAGVRDANRQLQSGSGAETAFLAAALQEVTLPPLPDGGELERGRF